MKFSGIFIFVDFYSLINFLFWFGFVMFLWLFEIEIFWKFININILELLIIIGFNLVDIKLLLFILYVGGSF